jgi:hypothetical protein
MGLFHSVKEEGDQSMKKQIFSLMVLSAFVGATTCVALAQSETTTTTTKQTTTHKHPGKPYTHTESETTETGSPKQEIGKQENGKQETGKQKVTETKQVHHTAAGTHKAKGASTSATTTEKETTKKSTEAKPKNKAEHTVKTGQNTVRGFSSKDKSKEEQTETTHCGPNNSETTKPGTSGMKDTSTTSPNQNEKSGQSEVRQEPTDHPPDEVSPMTKVKQGLKNTGETVKQDWNNMVHPNETAPSTNSAPSTP